MEQELFELDMERMYEDDSFSLDQANRELQELGVEQMDQLVEAAYDEYLDAMMSLYHHPDSYADEY